MPWAVQTRALLVTLSLELIGIDLSLKLWPGRPLPCFDPEIPVNIVDLGLIYDMRSEARQDGLQRVEVE